MLGHTHTHTHGNRIQTDRYTGRHTHTHTHPVSAYTQFKRLYSGTTADDAKKILIELVTSNRKLKASREGSK